MSTFRQHTILAIWGGLAVACVLSSSALAGPIFFAGELQDGKFAPNDEAAHCYSLRYSTISAAAEGRTAQIEIKQSVRGPEKAVQAVCLIPLPEGASAENFAVTARSGREEADEALAARFLTARQAQEVYEAISRGLDSVKILSRTGRPALLIPAFKLQGALEMTVRFAQQVRDDDGVLSLQCPMPATEFAKGPVARLTLTATLTGKQPLRAVFSPSHLATVDREGLRKAVVRVRAEDWAGRDDFRLCWVSDPDPLGLRVLTYRAEGEKDGFFMLLGNPTGGDEKPIDKDVVFVLDTSGSMRGEKIEQARAAIEYCVGQLNAGDRFNVVTFGTEVESFRDAPVPRSEKTLRAAREFIEDIVAQGRTNIAGALSKALSGQAAGKRPRIMIFLTDGTPTAGELVPDKIVEGVKAANTSGTRIFVMGVGHDVNAHLLDKLAETTAGSSEYVGPRQEIDAKVATLYDRLSHPVLTDVAVSFGGLNTYSVYPEKLPALFKGSEVMIFGRYQGGGMHKFRVGGMLHGEPVEYVREVNVPEETSTASTQFVAPLWAARNIGFLLQEIRLHGANEELTKEVIRLSKQFGIVTEYTAFLASDRAQLAMARMPAAGIPGGGGFEAFALEEAKRRLALANRQQAGRWAVNQALNDRELQSRVVATAEANYFRDSRGRAVAAQNIRQAGGRVFYLRDGQWVDGEEAGDRKTRNVKLYSDEYYNLLRNNADFARAQQLGWAVELNVGKDRIVVEKDGKTKDERLQTQQQQAQPGLNQAPNGEFNRGLQNFRNQFNQLQQVPNLNRRNVAPAQQALPQPNAGQNDREKR